MSSLASVMDALAAAPTSTAIKSRYGYPQESPGATPAWIVGYPEDIPAMVFGNAAYRSVFPCWFVVGKMSAEATRDALSEHTAGSASVIEDIEGASVGQSRAVSHVRVQQINLTGVPYMAARYDVDVIYDLAGDA